MNKAVKIGILCMAMGFVVTLACHSTETPGDKTPVLTAKTSDMVPPVVQGRGPSDDEIKKIDAAMPTKAVAKPKKPRRLLVINLLGPRAFYHDCIPYWNNALAIMAQKTGAFTVTFSSDPNVFKAENLKHFDAICFNNTVSLPLSPDKTPEMCKGLMDFVKGGKGVIGIHEIGRAHV